MCSADYLNLKALGGHDDGRATTLKIIEYKNGRWNRGADNQKVNENCCYDKSTVKDTP